MLLSLLLVLAVSPADTTPPEMWAPHRVYDAHHKRFSDFEALAAAAARSDVVFFGEQHDDPATHRMELALLQAVARRRGNVILTLEMFERDVQPILNDYLAGRIDERTFLEGSRPWPRYATDYRPLIEFAKAHRWQVIAGNVPRRMAAVVSSKGLTAITGLSDSTRPWAAAEFQCPKDDYFKRFGVAMGQHPMGEGSPPSPAALAAMTQLFYQAQCVKDETMAESIAQVYDDAVAGKSNGIGPLIIQYNGDFHSAFGEGTVARTKRRLPAARIMVISAIPVETLDSIDPEPSRKQGDWLLFTLKQP